MLPVSERGGKLVWRMLLSVGMDAEGVENEARRPGGVDADNLCETIR